MYKLQKQYRLKNYDYSQNGAYFITICTKNRIDHFGKIENEEMRLSEIGEIAKHFWEEIPNSFTNVQLDQFVVMPNHIHGIIMLLNNGNNNFNMQEEKDIQSAAGLSSRVHSNIHPLIKNSISSIINHYKGNVKRWCNKSGYDEFFWQARFYDHIIRNEKSLNNIREYIFYNPIKWYWENQNKENFANENVFK
jgi:putative transposase